MRYWALSTLVALIAAGFAQASAPSMPSRPAAEFSAPPTLDPAKALDFLTASANNTLTSAQTEMYARTHLGPAAEGFLEATNVTALAQDPNTLDGNFSKRLQKLNSIFADARIFFGIAPQTVNLESLDLRLPFNVSRVAGVVRVEGSERPEERIHFVQPLAGQFREKYYGAVDQHTNEAHVKDDFRRHAVSLLRFANGESPHDEEFIAQVADSLKYMVTFHEHQHQLDNAFGIAQTEAAAEYRAILASVAHGAPSQARIRILRNFQEMMGGLRDKSSDNYSMVFQPIFSIFSQMQAIIPNAAFRAVDFSSEYSRYSGLRALLTVPEEQLFDAWQAVYKKAFGAEAQRWKLIPTIRPS